MLNCEIVFISSALTNSMLLEIINAGSESIEISIVTKNGPGRQ